LPADATVVSQVNKLFNPSRVRLAAGRTLTVLNDDTRTHNVRIYSPKLDYNSGARSRRRRSPSPSPKPARTKPSAASTPPCA
jgi:cytochrome c peroxidase